MNQARVEAAVEAVRRGEMVVVVDDEDRENEGDLILAAEKITAEIMAFMIRHTSGVLCVPLPGERLDALELPLMVRQNKEIQRTAFTITVDAREGTTTGISAADRARTVKALVDPKTRPEDLARPGHIFPLRYREGGVLKRRGHTEAAVDLARLAGMQPAGVLAELVHDDGTMMRRPALEAFAQEHHLELITIEDLVAYRREHDVLVERIAETRLPTDYGTFRALVYRSLADGVEHLALVRGTVDGAESVLTRVHSECLTGDVFGSRRCDCGEQLEAALQTLGEMETGVLLYLRGHEGRGIGLGHKLRAYELQDRGLDTVEANLALGFPADAREYGEAAQILQDLHVRSVRLLTNNPAKQEGLEQYNVPVLQRVPLVIPPRRENARYLRTKQERMGHLLGIETDQSTVTRVG